MTQVQFSWARRPSQPTAEPLRRVICGVLERLGCRNGEVHVLMTDDQQIQALNREYRNHDCATDVLSFPDGDELPSGLTLLGQIVISLETARRQAEQLGHSELRELEELSVHGTIHLLGYDHDQDEGDMNQLELQLRQELLT